MGKGIKPSPEVIKQYLADCEELHQGGHITDDDYAYLVEHYKNLLPKETKNELDK